MIQHVIHKISIYRVAPTILILLSLFVAPFPLRAGDNHAVGIGVGAAVPIGTYALLEGAAAQPGYTTQISYSGDLDYPIASIGYSLRYARFANATTIDTEFEELSHEFPSITVNASAGNWITNALVIGPTFSTTLNRIELTAHTLVGYAIAKSPSFQATTQSGSDTYSLAFDSDESFEWILSIGAEVRYPVLDHLAVVVGMDLWYTEARFQNVSVTETFTDGTSKDSTIGFRQIITVVSLPIGIQLRF